MAYITGNHRKTVGLGVKSAKVQNGAPRQVQITCKSKSDGEAVKGAIAACNPNWSFYKADTFMDNVLGWGLVPGGQAVVGNWQTFRVRTGSKSESTGLVSDIGKCIDEYADYQDPYEEPGVVTSSGSSGISKTTLYLIIGAVVSIVIAILVTRKKK